MKSLIFNLIFQLAVTISFGQNYRVFGIIKNVEKTPIEYANIGILNQPFGTVSSLEGKFDLIIPEKYINDTLRVSVLGYKSQDFKIKDLMNDQKFCAIVLKKQVETLEEIVINSKRLKSYTKGRTRTNTSQQVIFANPDLPNQNLGSEIGKKFKLSNDDPSHLTKFRFFIKDNNFDSVKFRINIYSIKNNLPHKNLHNRSIFISADQSYTGWIEVDLSEYDIVVQEDIILAVEWIAHSIKGDLLNLPIIIPSFGSTHYYKFGSQNAWKKYGNLSSSMEVTYEQ